MLYESKAEVIVRIKVLATYFSGFRTAYKFLVVFSSSRSAHSIKNGSANSQVIKKTVIYMCVI